MTALVGVLSIAAFALAFWQLRVATVASESLSTAQGAAAVMRDPALDDDAREQRVQRASGRLFYLFLVIVGRSAAALAAAFVPVLLAAWTGVTSMDAVIAFLSRWDVILGALVVLTGAWLLLRRRRA